MGGRSFVITCGVKGHSTVHCQAHCTLQGTQYTARYTVHLRYTVSISVHLQSPVLSVLLLYSRLAPELVTGTVKKIKLLGATVLKHRAGQLQTKSFVYIWCLSCPKLFVFSCSALCFKTIAPVVYFFNGSSDKPWPQPTVQHTMSTKFPLLYSMFGLAGTGGQKNLL